MAKWKRGYHMASVTHSQTLSKDQTSANHGFPKHASLVLEAVLFFEDDELLDSSLDSSESDELHLAFFFFVPFFFETLPFLFFFPAVFFFPLATPSSSSRSAASKS